MPDKKIRVHELSKELNISNDELIAFLKEEGIEVKSHSSTIDGETAHLISELVQERKEAPADDELEDGVASLLTVTEDDVEDIPVPQRMKHVDGKILKEDRARSPRKQKKEQDKHVEPPAGREIQMRPPFVVKELADAMGLKPNIIIMELMKKGVMANINQGIDVDIATGICENHGFKLVAEKRTKGSGATSSRSGEGETAPEDRVYENAEVESRPPVVAFLGHVDHGKTSLQDKMRDTNVCAGEAGAITQHVGASTIDWNGHTITFIDTPGHEAFTAMRARGADTTDIVILVVAADDGFMPQTDEALSHAKAAGVTIIVAINKMDLPAADPEKVLRQMMERELMPEDWGGEFAAVKVSAETGDGLDDLLERIVLEAELLELKANPKLPGQAIVLESELEQGLGATASVLIKNGTVHQGDIVLCGQYTGKVKALIDGQGKRVKSAGPSIPIKLVGLNGVPICGDKLVVCENEREAKRLSAVRQERNRDEALQPQMAASLDDLLQQMKDESATNMKVIVKTDVQGTCEAVCASLKKIESEKIRLDIALQGVGAITENDVLLAAASGAIIVGFHVRVNPGVNQIARREGVEIHLYSIIYELIDRIQRAMEGRLDPEYQENAIGKAEILQIFALHKKGKVIGCGITEGVARINAKARVFRESELIYNGDIVSLRRYQDDVREVRAGMECGIMLDNFRDFEPGDRVEIYEVEQIQAKL